MNETNMYKTDMNWSWFASGTVFQKQTFPKGPPKKTPKNKLEGVSPKRFLSAWIPHRSSGRVDTMRQHWFSRCTRWDLPRDLIAMKDNIQNIKRTIHICNKTFKNAYIYVYRIVPYHTIPYYIISHMDLCIPPRKRTLLARTLPCTWRHTGNLHAHIRRFQETTVCKCTTQPRVVGTLTQHIHILKKTGNQYGKLWNMNIQWTSYELILTKKTKHMKVHTSCE